MFFLGKAFLMLSWVRFIWYKLSEHQALLSLHTFQLEMYEYCCLLSVFPTRL